MPCALQNTALLTCAAKQIGHPLKRTRSKIAERKLSRAAQTFVEWFTSAIEEFRATSGL